MEGTCVYELSESFETGLDGDAVPVEKVVGIGDFDGVETADVHEKLLFERVKPLVEDEVFGHFGI